MKVTVIAREASRELRQGTLMGLLTVAGNVKAFRGPTDMSDTHGEFTALTIIFLSPGETNDEGPAPRAA